MRVVGVFLNQQFNAKQADLRHGLHIHGVQPIHVVRMGHQGRGRHGADADDQFGHHVLGQELGRGQVLGIGGGSRAHSDDFANHGKGAAQDRDGQDDFHERDAAWGRGVS